MKNVKLLKRERIYKSLDRIFDYPLTIIEAPMGYGKTTAVKDFLTDTGGPVLWFSFLTAGDNTSFFWEGLTKQIGILDAGMGARLKSIGFPSDAPQVANILLMLDDMECEKNTVLVIDDYHLVKDLQISKLLIQIIKEEVENLHIVIITRDTSNLDFAELTACGLCYIISQQLLRFSDEEIREYCYLKEFIPTESDMKKISEYTGGWISLIYLILLGLEKGIPVGMNTVIDDLVEKNLYSAYDKRIRRFLLKISVLDSFTAEQALFVSRESKTDEFLKRLYRENAFITYDEPTLTYKIHNVLLDFLRMKQKNKAVLMKLYKRVGEWHLKQKEYVAAYGYLYRAGEIELILALLNNPNNVTNDLADFEGSMEMFAVAPRELLFRYPIAYLQYICLLLMSGNADVAEDSSIRLNELHKVYERQENIDPKYKNRVLAEINVICIFTVFNNADEMIAYTNKALRLLDGDQSCLMQRKSEFTFGCPHFLYSYYREPGRLKQTVDIMVNGFNAFARLADGCGTGCEYVTLAEYALETGDWQAAKLNCFKAFYKAQTKEQTGIVICAYFTLIRLYILQGKIAEGTELLKQLRLNIAQENSAIYNTTMDLCEGYIYGCLGKMERIPIWLQVGDMCSARFLFQGIAVNYIVYGKAVLLSKNYIKLEMLTESFNHYFSVFNNQLGFIHNHILAAAAKYQLYGMEKGVTALLKALEIGQADNIIMPFAEHAPAIFDILRTISHTDSRNEYVKSVYSACEQYIHSLKHIPRETPSLSARELEVLALAAEGLKRDEIARRLLVSTGTVRTHLQNIYQKLEVGSKIAAVTKAQNLKLF